MEDPALRFDARSCHELRLWFAELRLLRCRHLNMRGVIDCRWTAPLL
jgi:hypothetical protein